MGVKPVDIRDSAGALCLVSVYAPDVCPLCHHGIEPAVIVGVSRYNEIVGSATIPKTIQVFFQCPRANCRSSFIVDYARPVMGMELAWSNTGMAPIAIRPQVFSGRINKLSPNFVEIYNQSLKAREARFDIDLPPRLSEITRIPAEGLPEIEGAGR